MSLVTSSSVLLRSFPYSESSRILRFLTRDQGLVGVLARGIRKTGGQTGSSLETFASGDLTFYMKPTRDLQTFKEFTPSKPRRGLGVGAERLGGASIMVELVLKHAGEEASPQLFDALEEALDRVETASDRALLPAVLSGGWGIVSALGYGPVLETCVQCGAPLDGEEMARFDFPAGGVRCHRCSSDSAGPRVGPAARVQLRALIAGDAPPSTLQRPRAHLQLLSDFVTHHVSGARPLGSFAFLARLLPEDDA
jgi:DNA repair protein RecO (recombination protein O)